MRILALETTDKTGGVAAMDGDNLLAELTLDQSQRSAQSLAPGMRQLLKNVGWQPQQVELVAVSIGPGSFTGLRVGVTSAKVFAYAVGAEVLGIDTLETVAANAGDAAVRPGSTVSVVMDAQRGEVVVRSFTRRVDGWFEPAGPQELLAADAWLARLAMGGCETVGGDSCRRLCGATPEIRRQESPPTEIPDAVVTGPGLLRLIDRLPPGVAALDRELWRPRAAVVARLAARHYAEGRRDDLWKLAPRYYRRSAAEEKWDARVTPT